MINSSANSFPKFDVENHQTMLNSKKHLDLKREIEETMGLYKNRFSNTSSNKPNFFAYDNFECKNGSWFSKSLNNYVKKLSKLMPGVKLKKN